jgi:hypothetical protein
VQTDWLPKNYLKNLKRLYGTFSREKNRTATILNGISEKERSTKSFDNVSHIIHLAGANISEKDGPMKEKKN